MKVLIVTTQYPNKSRQTTNPAVFYQVEGLRKIGVDVDVGLVDSIVNGKLAYLYSIPKITRLWKKGRYDILHVHFGGLLAFIGSLVAGKRTIITYHGTDLHGGTPTTYLSKIKSLINTRFSILAAKQAGGLVVVSPNLKDFLPAQIHQKSIVLPTGVDYSLFTPIQQDQARQELALDLNKKYILFSSISNSPVKRLDTARAVEIEVCKHMPEAELLMLSRQPYLKVPLYLNAADCLLLTSDKEGSPNIVKEALAVNLPIVSVDVGDVKLRCQGVPNCQIVDRDIASLSNAVLAALKMSRSNGGKELKRPEIDNEFICREIEKFYRDILKRLNG
jgi:glycosyltransferase involved in cell wall biosynthesis